jgi:alpha-galactosidase
LYEIDMHRLTIARTLVSLSIVVSSSALGQVATLTTQQTTLQVEAGERAPRVLGLKSGELAAWKNSVAEDLIESAEVGPNSVPLTWKLNRSASHVDSGRVAFVYESSSPHLRLTWQWTARAGTGPLEHTIHIENLSSDEIWIPLQDSFRFRWNVEPQLALSQLYVDKGSGKPSPIGTHQVAIPIGYTWQGLSSTYDRNVDSWEIIPWFMVQREGTSQDGWYVGVEFSGRTRLTLERDKTAIHGSVGLNPEPGPFRTRLLPGESFDTPAVFVGGFRRGADGLGNTLRPWVRQVLTNQETWKNEHYPTLVNNSWGSGMQVDEKLSLRMIHDSAELGLELFHIDAGWFRGVGDWYPDPVKFPHGLAAIADEAHKNGLKFGIWVNWAEAGIDTQPGALDVNNPAYKDWLVADVPPGWKPDEFVGRTVDLGSPAVKNYAQKEVLRIVNDYRLDMLEHDGYVVTKNCDRSDHPHSARPRAQMSVVKDRGLDLPDAANSTDVSYHATRAYYEIYSELRRQHPNILLEICNDGGRMVDFGSASHGDYFSITDSYDPLSNRKAFYDASHLLPPAMLEDYVMEVPTPRIENFRAMLRSGMMGWASIMQDTNKWSAEQHAAAKAEFALYKSDLRPLIRDADLFHISERPDGVNWDAIEYFNAAKGRGAIYAFRGTAPDEDQHIFQLQGIRADRQYRLRFQDHSMPDRTVPGSELLKSGVTLKLPITNSSEIVHIEDTKQ